MGFGKRAPKEISEKGPQRPDCPPPFRGVKEDLFQFENEISGSKAEFLSRPITETDQIRAGQPWSADNAVMQALFGQPL